jgi:hypothetical protein
MTIAISLKIGDGIILGADSAVMLAGPGQYPQNVYFNAEKIINLVKGLPLGAVTYGLGGFGGRSAARLAKDLRWRLSEPGHPWQVNPVDYTVEEVAERVKEFFYDELYLDAYPQGGAETGFGFLVAGYGPRSLEGEVWGFDVSEVGVCSGPYNAIPEADGLLYRGEGEALHRLLRGWSEETLQALEQSGLADALFVERLEAVAPLWNGQMPIQDGIDVVRYLIDVTAGFVRYSNRLNAVAPPVDLATITLHEGFRWVARKLYYSRNLNPDDSR